MNEYPVFLLLMILGIGFIIVSIINSSFLVLGIGLTCMITSIFFYVYNLPTIPVIYKLFQTPLPKNATNNNYGSPSLTVVIKPVSNTTLYTASIINGPQLISISSSSNVIHIPIDISGRYTVVVTSQNRFTTSLPSLPHTITTSTISSTPQVNYYPIQSVKQPCPIGSYIDPTLKSCVVCSSTCSACFGSSTDCVPIPLWSDPVSSIISLLPLYDTDPSGGLVSIDELIVKEISGGILQVGSSVFNNKSYLPISISFQSSNVTKQYGLFVNTKGGIVLSFIPKSYDNAFYLITILLNQTQTYLTPIIVRKKYGVVNTLPLFLQLGPFSQEGLYTMSMYEYTSFGPSLPYSTTFSSHSTINMTIDLKQNNLYTIGSLKQKFTKSNGLEPAIITVSLIYSDGTPLQGVRVTLTNDYQTFDVEYQPSRTYANWQPGISSISTTQPLQAISVANSSASIETDRNGKAVFYATDINVQNGNVLFSGREKIIFRVTSSYEDKNGLISTEKTVDVIFKVDQN